MLEKYCIVSSKTWNKHLADRLQNKLGVEWRQVDKKEDFTFKSLKA